MIISVINHTKGRVSDEDFHRGSEITIDADKRAERRLKVKKKAKGTRRSVR